MKHDSVGALSMQPGGVCVGLRKELCWRGRKGDQVAGTAGMEASPSRGGIEDLKGATQRAVSRLLADTWRPGLERTGNNQVVGDRAYLVCSLPLVC
jgi:hypothetical protein